MHVLLNSVLLTLQQATADPCFHWRLLDTHGHSVDTQVWVSLLWGNCSFLLGPGAHKGLFVPSQSLFPQSCVSSSGSMVGLMATSSKRAYAIPRSAASRALAPVAGHCWPIPLQETLRHSSGSVSGVSGSWCAQSLSEPPEHLWRVWGLILNMISPLLPSCWGFSFALGRMVSFFGGIQHSSVESCLAASCNFGVLTEVMSSCPSSPPSFYLF